jgi:hypothetical protein
MEPRSKRTPHMRLQLLEENIRRNLKDNIWNEKDSQGDIRLVAL